MSKFFGTFNVIATSHRDLDGHHHGASTALKRMRMVMYFANKNQMVGLIFVMTGTVRGTLKINPRSPLATAVILPDIEQLPLVYRWYIVTTGCLY